MCLSSSALSVFGCFVLLTCLTLTCWRTLASSIILILFLLCSLRQTGAVAPFPHSNRVCLVFVKQGDSTGWRFNFLSKEEEEAVICGGMCASLKLFCWSSVDYKRGEDEAWSSTKHNPTHTSNKQPTRLCCWRGDSVTLHRWSQTLWVSWKKTAGWSLGVKGSFSLRAPSLSSNFGRQHEPQPPVPSEPSAAANDHFQCGFTQCSPTLLYSVHFHTVWLSGLQLSLSLRRTWIRLTATQQSLIHLSSVWVYWTDTRLQ